jgi:tRNA threonylcarbamoyladenosine biosynthesis protein TsaE
VGARRVDEAALAALGGDLARRLRPPAVVGIAGDLGTGKTTLARAMARALGVTEPVTSPTFALVHRYAGTGVTVFHVDGYRLRRPGEAADLGLDDAVAEPDSVILIEWPERLGAWLPPVAMRITLAYADDPLLRQVEVDSDR